MLELYASLFRTCWIDGRYGGGKTLLAIALAERLIASGTASGIVSNTPLMLPGAAEPAIFDEFSEVTETVENAVIIYDEAWQDLGMGASPGAVRQYMAYLRKQNLILLMPSVLPLSRQVRVLRVWREFNGLPFGLPFWIYRYKIEGTPVAGRKRDKWDVFWLWNPRRLFKYYDHLARPDNCWYYYTQGGQFDVQGE